MFGAVNSALLFGLISHDDSTLYYVITDLLAKFMTMSLIYDAEEQRIEIGNQMDLQSFHLISTILTTIYNYKEENELSNHCAHTLEYIKENIKAIIPKDTHKTAKIELLKKILPYDLDDSYLLSNINRYNKHENVCILFTDIVDYSDFSCKISETLLYNILNNIYTQFDIRIRKYKSLQKIETIGDSYMVVGDLMKQHDKSVYVKEMIQLAFDLNDICSTILLPNRESIRIRIGIHIGDVVVGLLGVDIPRLCVIGNSVNLTSRLESNSQPNKIHISREIYDIIKEDDMYDFKERPSTYLKNIGTYTTYFIALRSIQSMENAE
jgi:class 3 adenylate cyclase